MHPYTEQSKEELIAENIKLRDELNNTKPVKKPRVFRRWHMALLLLAMSGISVTVCAVFAEAAMYDHHPIFIIPGIFFGAISLFLLIWMMVCAASENTTITAKYE